MKVLIVDDAPVIREILRQLLIELKDIDIVGEAETVSEAVEAASAYSPDLILLDFQLKDGNALQVLKEIKSQNVSTSVLIFTNYTENRYREACYANGADGFYDKNKDIFLLSEAITDLKKRMK